MYGFFCGDGVDFGGLFTGKGSWWGRRGVGHDFVGDRGGRGYLI